MAAVRRCGGGGRRAVRVAAGQPTEPADTEARAAEETPGGAHQENELEIPEDMVRDLRITTTVVESRSDAEQSTITGELRVDENNYAEVAAPLSGRVSRLYATVGQSVRAGQPLAEIQSADLGRARAAIETATARVELARNSRRAQTAPGERAHRAGTRGAGSGSRSERGRSRIAGSARDASSDRDAGGATGVGRQRRTIHPARADRRNRAGTRRRARTSHVGFRNALHDREPRRPCG